MKRVLLIFILCLISSVTEANISKRDLLCLKTTSYYEAKGEDLLGMMLIANVIINRSHEEKFCKVAGRRGQFAYNVSSKIPKDLSEILDESVVNLYKGCYKIPKHLKEATHFHNNRVKPKWTKQMVYLGRYKHHLFYKTRDT